MAKRRSPRTHVLIAGDSLDLGLLELLVTRLPKTAYGQIFVEIEHADEELEWELPVNVMCTWLLRDVDNVMTPRGELLEAALESWRREWMPDGEFEDAAPRAVWIGGSANERVGRIAAELAMHVDGVAAQGLGH